DPLYDPRLEGIVLKALERDPRRRFQSARKMQESLEELAHNLRLRLSPMALADYMQVLFADKIGAWQAASADGDRAALERHFATVMAEREADLEAEEAVAAPVAELPPSEVQLSSLPSEDLRPRRRGRAWLVMVVLAGAAALALWRYRHEAV